jgi:hypothetical protein
MARKRKPGIAKARKKATTVDPRDRSDAQPTTCDVSIPIATRAPIDPELKGDGEAVPAVIATPLRIQSPVLAQMTAEREARSFRAMGKQVYPGVLLVTRNGFSAFAVEDDCYDSSRDSILAIAVWGATDPSENSPSVSVMEGGVSKMAVVAFPNQDRRTTGVDLVDAWIARADTLRRLRSTGAFAPGRENLDPARWRAGIIEVESVTKATALALIHQAPDAKHPALRALARVANTDHPSSDDLTYAMEELIAASPSWKASQPADRSRSASWPTALDLRNAVKPLSFTTFGRIRDDAGIKLTARGGAAQKHRYSPSEVSRMIEAANRKGRHLRIKIAAEWKKWSVEGGKNSPP